MTWTPGRLPDGEPAPWPPPNGSFWRMQRRADDQGLAWYVMTPNGLFGCLANHAVIEHEDGAISVTPSILVESTQANGVLRWHGYLEHGVWREC